MKKAAYVSMTILEILCLAGVWTIQYFTHGKMGMTWYIMYKDRSQKTRYPVESLANGTVLLTVVLIVMLLLYPLGQRGNLTRTVWLMNAGMMMLTSAYGGFTWMNSADEVRTYYFISAILGSVSLIQTAEMQIGMLVHRHGRQGVGRNAG